MIPSPISVASVVCCQWLFVIVSSTMIRALISRFFLKVGRNYNFISTKETAFTGKQKGGQGDLRGHGRLGLGSLITNGATFTRLQGGISFDRDGQVPACLNIQDLLSFSI